MFTVIGEALVDVVNRPNEPKHAHAGGSPMNVAVGVSRLGHETEFIGRYGNDEYGSIIDSHLRDSGVILPAGSDALKTSVAQANISENGAADYEFDLDWSLDAARDALKTAGERSTAVHTGSIGAMLEPGAADVLETIKAAKSHALVTYDPNCRPSIIPDSSEARSWAKSIVPHTDVIKASDEDLLWLYPNRTPEETAKVWLTAGASLVIVTRGEMGPWAINASTGDKGVSVPAHRVEVADTVGAGDSLMAALITSLLDRGIEGSGAAEKLSALSAEELIEILKFSSTAAGITVSRAGANPPTRDELDEVLKGL